MEFDRDLQSIQEVRNLIANAKQAQRQMEEYSQEQIDAIVREIALACAAKAEVLAKMAVEETGFGVWQDKVVKNQFASTHVYENYKNLKTIGILSRDEKRGIMEVAVPMGIIAGLIPSTNPTSTTIYKAIVSIKAGNVLIVSPHPSAIGCITETVRIIREAIRRAGAPEDIVQCTQMATMEGTNALLTHPAIGVILATGGEAMVHAAYCSGNPAIGVGPGNGPAFIEKTADIPAAVKMIFESKTFDNGTICASEQSIVAESVIAGSVRKEFIAQGGYFLTGEESARLSKLMLRANGTMNPKIVGKSAAAIGEMAGIRLPEGTRIILSEETAVSRSNPYSREKLCPILAFYEEENWLQSCKRCLELLNNEGAGHTMTIHSSDETIIEEFALKKPISRLLVNTPAALGGIGATTNLQPALTLGCGAVGGSSTSDNVGPMNLLNIRRVARGARTLSDVRGDSVPGQASCGRLSPDSFSQSQVEVIAREVLKRLAANR